MKDTAVALKWIVAILEKHDIPYQITGGFAARLYGATRELADIDIDVSNDCFETIYEEVSTFIIFGPEQYIDENWNLKLMTLEYKGQVIDIAGEAKIFDQVGNEWKEQKTDFNDSNFMAV